MTPFIVNVVFITLFIINTLLLLYVITKRMFRDKHQKAKIERENERLHAYINSVEMKIEELRLFTREYNEIVQKIGNYLDRDEIGELSKLLKNITFTDTPPDEIIMGKLSNVKTTGIRGLLYFKVLQANNANLDVEVDIGGNIYDIPMHEIDLIRVLGVLLDNAIEESVKTKDKKLYIGVYQEEDQSSTVMQIGNTYVDMPDIRRMFDKGYTTKGENRGTGLYSVDKILNKYPQAKLRTRLDNGLFTVELYIK
jgi:two-component system sensor histidine kinase AgrC